MKHNDNGDPKYKKTPNPFRSHLYLIGSKHPTHPYIQSPDEGSTTRPKYCDVNRRINILWDICVLLQPASFRLYLYEQTDPEGNLLGLLGKLFEAEQDSFEKPFEEVVQTYYLEWGVLNN